MEMTSFAAEEFGEGGKLLSPDTKSGFSLHYPIRIMFCRTPQTPTAWSKTKYKTYVNKLLS